MNECTTNIMRGRRVVYTSQFVWQYMQDPHMQKRGHCYVAANFERTFIMKTYCCQQFMKKKTSFGLPPLDDNVDNGDSNSRVLPALQTLFWFCLVWLQCKDSFQIHGV